MVSRKRASYLMLSLTPFLLLFSPLLISINSLETRVRPNVQNNMAPTLFPIPTVSKSKEPAAQRWEWVEIPHPVEDAITSCQFLSVDDGWVISLEGAILHWDGKQWLSVPNPAKEDYPQLYSISMLSPHDGWIVGWFGLMMHWNGTEWKRLPPVTDSDLGAVSFVSRNLGFAAGGRGPLGDKDADWAVLQWDGKQWNQAAFPREQGGWRIDLLRITSKQEGWASALKSLYHWDGRGWKEYISRENNRLFWGLSDMSSLAPDDVWAVGTNADYQSGNRGVVIHWDGSQWKSVATSRYDLVNIRMFSPDMGWAIGVLANEENARESESVLLNWDGTQWSEFPVPKEVGNGEICGYDREHVWIFGGKRVYPSPYSDEFHSVLFQLVEKPSPTSTATTTVTSTPIPVQESITPTLEVHIPVQSGLKWDGILFLLGGLFALIVILIIFAKKR